MIFKLWKQFQLHVVYDFEHHVRIAEALEEKGALPSTFMLIPPHSQHEDVWTDITRMLSMNTLQAGAGRELHLCPLQFDIVDRAIAQYSQPGETVFDPFGGLMTVPYRALKAGRKGIGIELSANYFFDGCAYVEAMARELAMPSLFDLMTAEPTS